jgi:hypothetical protein
MSNAPHKPWLTSETTKRILVIRGDRRPPPGHKPMAKSRGLFPGPKSRPKRVFASAAGSPPVAPKQHTDDGFGYEQGMMGWKAGRMAGGQSIDQPMKGKPASAGGAQFDSLQGEGGMAYDSSMAPYLSDRSKPAAAKGKP